MFTFFFFQEEDALLFFCLSLGLGVVLNSRFLVVVLVAVKDAPFFSGHRFNRAIAAALGQEDLNISPCL